MAKARQEEVRRLARLAAAEAERAEMEAVLVYSAEMKVPEAVAASVPAEEASAAAMPRRWLRGCFAPGASPRPREVREVQGRAILVGLIVCDVTNSTLDGYNLNSGKCQIIHWRQGHKDECHPPRVHDKEDQLSTSNSKKVQSEQPGPSDNNVVLEGQLPAQPVDSFRNRPESSETNFSGNILNKDLMVEDMTSSDASIETSDKRPVNQESILHRDAILRESVASAPSTSVSTPVDSGDDNLSASPVPEIPSAGSPINTSYSEDLKEKVSASNDKAVDHRNSQHSENTIEGQENAFVKGSQNKFVGHKCLAHEKLGPTDSSRNAASNEDTRIQFKQAKSQDSGTKKSELRSSASASSASEMSTSAGISKAIDTSAKSVGAPKVLPRPAESGGPVSNSVTTSLKSVLNHFPSSKLVRHYPPEFRQMLFPYDQFVKLYNSNKVEFRPCGLINCGNSCYANAVLQCLAFTRPLTAYLLEGLHSKTCLKKEWCFTCEFESLVMNAKQGKSPLSPIGVLSNLHKIGSGFDLGKEEDAHEFLRFVIDAMQSVCRKEAGPNATGRLAEETTLIQLTFGGYLRSKIKCMKCLGKSEQYERMMDLTVEIQGEIGTLEEALLQFTSTEVLDGENKYQCSRCNSYERAKKKLTILEAPNILTITLKRFESGKFGKLNKAVRFPEYLNLARYMSATDDKSPVYQLYAVVVHLDVMNSSFSGHYVCYVKDTQGKWYKTDDTKVKPVELEHVLSKGAYMLLYARCSPRAPSSVRRAIRVKKIRSKTPNAPGFHGGSSFGQLRGDDPFNALPFRLFGETVRPNTDSSSDSSSLFSNSDEGSFTTESTRDSTSTEEYSEYLFGDSDRMSWNNSPLRYSDETENGGNSASNPSSSGREVDGLEVGFEGGESPSFLYSDTSKQRRELTEQSREVETDWANPNVVKANVLLRRPTRERTTQPFYS
ncbi:Ubiquitin carboxyl-terminal hydrolase 17 [Ananas comosus]|uniref:Ubiquitin carboxyl-terminal hydrolase 17 n=1 Tax=Ananas comosus TaxID=4615 RepID=A0A199UY38_ANACO|nr:Ubiquitin carboxyl-terminal hydrolase 17 [Ananas comosus]